MHYEGLFLLRFIDMLIIIYCAYIKIIINKKIENSEIKLTNHKLTQDVTWETLLGESVIGR